MSRCGHTPAEVKMLGGVTELSVGSSLCYGFEATCPFCGGRFAAGYTRAGALELSAGRVEVSLHTPVLLHSEPRCDQFESMGPVEYLVATRRYRERSGN